MSSISAKRRRLSGRRRSPGRDLRSMSMKIKPEKVDRLFDEASDILREAHLLMLEAQVNTLNLLRPMGLESSPRVVASVEDREAA
jgi:hypothetical protein